ncbi:uncharacterized protein KY384_005248 [Bacidia gigantensis]|uniref:uncharacterized protein n=1 Tax=Bacidia gigantensis TaxID=2732470 RepID=UPI001D049BA5|nr:uncharacterized protein KY384_005248 [Bacidia gigantensis]KAG8529767.1 hypothetical protein KY384_005248 [Bacidia gigantensis]
MAPEPLRIGYVPEHFSTPLYFAKTKHNAPWTLIPFPSGTGHMIEALKSQSIDIGIGLTEGWIAGLARNPTQPPPYALVGTYVENPLRWAISTGGKREDFATQSDPGEWMKELKGKRMGVSRVGSGSYVMGFVVGDKMGWLEEGEEPFEVVVLETFEKLREGVSGMSGANDSGGGGAKADFFMWEHFTSKRYFDSGEIRKIGEVVTPWPSWHVVARPEVVDKDVLEEFFTLLDQGVKFFQKNHGEAVEYISTELDYSKEDAEEWLMGVQFAKEVKGVRQSVVNQTIEVLKKAGVVGKDVDGEGMIKISRQEPGLLSALIG